MTIRKWASQVTRNWRRTKEHNQWKICQSSVKTHSHNSKTIINLTIICFQILLSIVQMGIYRTPKLLTSFLKQITNLHNMWASTTITHITIWCASTTTRSSELTSRHKAMRREMCIAKTVTRPSISSSSRKIANTNSSTTCILWAWSRTMQNTAQHIAAISLP